MDFFEHQDAARKNTRIMVILYMAAVAGVVLAVDLMLAVVYVKSGGVRLVPGTGVGQLLRAVPGHLYVWGALGTMAVIFTASLVQILRLAQGGPAVAQMVGARAVSQDTRDPLEKRLLNVVEEMAVAAGVRVPQCYVMDEEPGINAFAAGYDVGNAVVAVTRGTLDTLSRDELQGVIGHEFSHILNGDMWLNIKMIGVLSGIVFIGGVGGFLMRSVRSGTNSRSSSGLFAIGLALFVIGYIGMFFARIIKAAVSRQREYLADASAVQFTRNPDGIAGALDQIRASGRGALITNRYAEDMSHMFFGQGITTWMAGLFATHPPIEGRIARVRPGFHVPRYRQERARFVAPAPIEAEFGAGSGFAGAPSAVSQSGSDGKRASDSGHPWGRSAGESAKLVGTLDAGKVNHAARLIARLPPDVNAAMHDPGGACAVIVALLLAPKGSVLEVQLEAVHALGDASLAVQAQSVLPSLQRLGRGKDLMLIDLSLPAIKSATPAEKQRLVAALVAVIRADRRVSLHEFVVLTFVKTQLSPRARPGAGKGRPLSALRDEIVLLMSLVAHAGRRSGPEPALDRAVEEAFSAGALIVGMADTQLLAKDGLSLDATGNALERLRSVAPLAKAILVKALFAVVSADGTIRLMEAELMRLIGAVLDCPLPPLFEDIDPETLAG